MISKTPRSVAPTGFKSEPEKTLCSPIAPLLLPQRKSRD
jgi:hypothetical protein